MKKVLFIDRDGTIISEPEDEQIDSFTKLKFLPGAITNLARIADTLDYDLVMVTNQDGLGTDSFPEDTFWPVQSMIVEILESAGVTFDDIFIDKTFERENAPTRKPKTGMLQKYIHGDYDLSNSFVIGDRQSDVALARNLGSKAIHIALDKSTDAELTTMSWDDIYNFLNDKARIGTIIRKTNETNISVRVNLDGSGKSNINTGLGFFDHMLEQIARHGAMDIDVMCAGDLEIDEHHTIEDTGLALGAAFRQALGSKKGIERYGFLLPMDDALAQVAIDFGGRPWLNWSADFRREKIGEMPTEMFHHFFKSFSDTAQCNLDIQSTGDNEHHKIEGIFKAFARAIKMAVGKTGTGIPSTKGVL